MGLNKSKGNMYEFITHTWNAVKGACSHDCSYCYMRKWGQRNHVRFDNKELKTDLGKNNFIFVGSGCDMWASNIPNEWIDRTLIHCDKFDNKYFFQTKNTQRFDEYSFSDNISLCATIETNRFYKEVMGNTPNPINRVLYLPENNYITIEPIMDFDLNEFLSLLKKAKPKQVNIGSDSGNNCLPEPSKEKIIQLINGMMEFTKVVKKKNIYRLIK